MLLGIRRLFITFIARTVDNYGGDIKMIATAVYKEGNDKNLMNKYPYRKTVEKAIIMFYLHENQSLKVAIRLNGRRPRNFRAGVALRARQSQPEKGQPPSSCSNLFRFTSEAAKFVTLDPRWDLRIIKLSNAC